jgi:hypothetical protein
VAGAHWLAGWLAGARSCSLARSRSPPLTLRSNYEQLGLSFQLHSAEILFNCGLAKIYLGQGDAGLADLREAAGQKVLREHGVIDDAIRDRGADYNVFSVPVSAAGSGAQRVGAGRLLLWCRVALCGVAWCSVVLCANRC